MAIAFVIVLPIGFAQAFAAAALLALLLAGIGVGICSSVIPYICDQLAMAQLSLASFAMMLALLPATATVIGAVVLDQIPSASDLIGIALVMGGVALHRKVVRGWSTAILIRPVLQQVDRIAELRCPFRRHSVHGGPSKSPRRSRSCCPPSPLNRTRSGPCGRAALPIRHHAADIVVRFEVDAEVQGADRVGARRIHRVAGRFRIETAAELNQLTADQHILQDDRFFRIAVDLDDAVVFEDDLWRVLEGFRNRPPNTARRRRSYPLRPNLRY